MRGENAKHAVQHYFVDESGSGVIFDKKGRVIIGSEGCPNFFMMGLLTTNNLSDFRREFAKLWNEVAEDSYLNRIPSIRKRIDSNKPGFHAKDDVPEVRKEVFKLLARSDVRFSAVIKDMQVVLKYVRDRESREPDYHYHPDELYDFMVRQLFRDRLHTYTSYIVHFAKRRADRSQAFKKNLDLTRERFVTKYRINRPTEISIKVQPPWMEPGLQAVDYFLWALQRLYERSEDRFILYIWDKVSVVRDLDDRREANYGMYYTRKRPLTASKIANRRI